MPIWPNLDAKLDIAEWKRTDSDVRFGPTLVQIDANLDKYGYFKINFHVRFFKLIWHSFREVVRTSQKLPHLSHWYQTWDHCTSRQNDVGRWGHAGVSGLAPTLVRLSWNGTHPRLFVFQVKLNIRTFSLNKLKCNEIISESVPYLSYFGPIWPTLEPNLNPWGQVFLVELDRREFTAGISTR